MLRNQKQPSATLLVVRVKQDHLPCFIAGEIVNKNALQYRSVKDFNGVGIFHSVNKSDAHLSPCDCCPPEEEVLSALPNQQTKYDNYREAACIPEVKQAQS